MRTISCVVLTVLSLLPNLGGESSATGSGTIPTAERAYASWRGILLLQAAEAVDESQRPSTPPDSGQRRRAVADRHFQLAQRLLEAGDRMAALGHLRYCVQLDPTHVEAYRALGFLYYRYRGFELGDRMTGDRTAETFFDRVIELDPSDVAARYYRAQIRAKWGEFDAAAEDLREALDLAGPNPAVLEQLGAVQVRRGELAAAADTYDRLVAATGATGGYYAWLGRLVALGTPPLELVGPDVGALPPPLPPPDVEPSPTNFVDVAPDLGVDRLSHGRGVAWTDVDGDGHDDLFATGIGDPHSLALALPGGGFRDATDDSGLWRDSHGGWSALAVDFDNDDDPDLFVTRDGWEGRGANSLYVNDGSGRFQDRGRELGVAGFDNSFTAAAADYDRDGFVDLYVANGVTSLDGAPNALYHNEGGRGFREVAAAAGVAGQAPSVGTTWGDYNGDGLPDLYVANYGADNALYRNRGDGTFEDVTAAAGAAGPRYSFMTFFFDYDNDARLDLFVASWTQDTDDVVLSAAGGRVTDPERRLALLHNEGDGTFRDVTEEAGLGLNMGAMSATYLDVDNDGYLDLVIGTGGPALDRYEPDRVFRNRGDGTFVEITASSGLGSLRKTHGLAAHDHDGDGDLDLFAAAGGQEPTDHHRDSLFRNDGADGNHWLTVKLVGTRSNRDAVGAAVTVTAGGIERFLEVAVGVGFGCTPSLPLEFGLGASATAERVEIRWPSGERQLLEDVPADRTITVVEGEPGYR